MRVLVLISLAMACASCGKENTDSAAEFFEDSMASLTEDEVIAAAKAEVVSKSPDPSAAQWRNVAVVGDMVCGEVNNKNRMGAYDGFTPFIHRTFSDGSYVWELKGFNRLGSANYYFDGCKFPGADQCFVNATVGPCMTYNRDNLIAEGLPARELGIAQDAPSFLEMDDEEEFVTEEPNVPEPASPSHLPPDEASYTNPTFTVRQNALVSDWHDADSRCRGGSGDAPATSKACEQRWAIQMQIKEEKLCHGRRGQETYEFQWHRCGYDSFQ